MTLGVDGATVGAGLLVEDDEPGPAVWFWHPVSSAPTTATTAPAARKGNDEGLVSVDMARSCSDPGPCDGARHGATVWFERPTAPPSGPRTEGPHRALRPWTRAGSGGRLVGNPLHQQRRTLPRSTR
ncbi:hypothetical protein CELD12_25310 [Cellulomonas sp. NTE-D12]|nr:hypothetical protein CELD12_25310 [Cellulomonas sp. NTE-D12]